MEDSPLCVAPEDRAERALDSDEDGGDEDDIEESNIDSDNESAKGPKLSDYELTKQKNIAENRALLKKVMAGCGFDDHLPGLRGNDGATKGRVTAKKGKKKATPDNHQQSSRWEKSAHDQTLTYESAY